MAYTPVHGKGTVLKIGASNVNLFAGVGGQGLQLSQVDFGIALFKPTTVGSKSSYFAFKATAKSVALVGIDGVTISANNLVVEVNSASVPGTRPIVLDTLATTGG